MIERTPILNILTHLILLVGFLLLLLPLWMAFVAASHDITTVSTAPIEFIPGGLLLANMAEAWGKSDFDPKFLNSFIVANCVVTGKITLSVLTAFGIVFFNHRLRVVIFWLIFITLMLPLEVRMVPTYAVAANALSPFQTILDAIGLTRLIEILSGVRIAMEWNLLNSYTGLILPLVATATGTFLYRQFFLTIPDELVEAAKMDGAGPLRFFWDVLLPLSRTNNRGIGDHHVCLCVEPISLAIAGGHRPGELRRRRGGIEQSGPHQPDHRRRPADLASGDGGDADDHGAARPRRRLHAALVRARPHQHR